VYIIATNAAIAVGLYLLSQNNKYLFIMHLHLIKKTIVDETVMNIIIYGQNLMIASD
jgi:hypothetical protein